MDPGSGELDGNPLAHASLALGTTCDKAYSDQWRWVIGEDVHRILLALCLAGAAIYTANVLLLGDKRISFGDSVIATTEQRVANQAASSPHLNPLPDEPEAQLPAPNLQLAPSNPEQASEADRPLAEWAQLLRAADARSGPSVFTRSLRTFPPGTQLQVIKREKGWVFAADPSSSERGWIYEQNLTQLTTPRPLAQTAQGSSKKPGPEQKPLQEQKLLETQPKQSAERPGRKANPLRSPKLAKSRGPAAKNVANGQKRQRQFHASRDRRLPHWDRDFLPPDEAFWGLPPTGRRGQRHFADEYIPPHPGRGFWKNRFPPPPPWESDW